MWLLAFKTYSKPIPPFASSFYSICMLTVTTDRRALFIYASLIFFFVIQSVYVTYLEALYELLNTSPNRFYIKKVALHRRIIGKIFTYHMARRLLRYYQGTPYSILYVTVR